MQPSQPRPKKLLDQVRDVIRVKHYAYRTEQTYVQWVRRYILFHNKRHPREMGVPEIEAFLTDLAINRKVAASTQNQALSALLFLYNEVLLQPLDERINAIRAKKPKTLPTVLTPEEARSVFSTCLVFIVLLCSFFTGVDYVYEKRCNYESKILISHSTRLLCKTQKEGKAE